MKWILAFLFMPLFSFSQDCRLKDVKDAFNQDPRLTTGFKTFGEGNNMFMVSVSADKREIDVFFALTESPACYDEFSRAVLIYEGGKQKNTFKNGGTRNCKGYFHFIFKNSETLHTSLKNLASRKVIRMEITANDDSKKVIEIDEKDQVIIQSMINCVLEQLSFLRTDTWKPKT